jgi:polyisoprenoid-binding protein YceI
MQPPVQRPTLFRLICAALLACAAMAASGAPQTFAIDPASTHVHWELMHFGTSTLRGRFDAISGSVTLDREAHTGSASISIETTSVSTGTRIFDGVVRGPLLLATQEHPSAYFVASRFAFDGDRLASVTGEFTLRGSSQPLTLKAMRFGCRTDAASAPATPRDICGGDFEAEFKRSDFGITHSLPFVGDAVRLVVQIEGVRR